MCNYLDRWSDILQTSSLNRQKTLLHEIISVIIEITATFKCHYHSKMYFFAGIENCPQKSK